MALVVLLVFGNGWWKSYQAGQAAARAQAAVTARDWPGAFAAARAAVTLRPEDAAHRALYESAQQDWLKYLRAAGTGDEAFGLFAQTPADIAVNLSESAAADYARLREDVQNAYRQRLRAAGAEAEALAQQGNFAGADAKLARLRTFGVLDAAELAASEGGVKAIQARAGIRAALELAAGGDTAGATARLDALAKTGAIPDELAAARRQVQTVAEVTVVDQLARAVLAGDATTTQAALNAYAKVTGQPVTITAAQLLGERDFDKFLRLLEQLRMRSAAGTARTKPFRPRHRRGPAAALPAGRGRRAFPQPGLCRVGARRARPAAPRLGAAPDPARAGGGRHAGRLDARAAGHRRPRAQARPHARPAAHRAAPRACRANSRRRPATPCATSSAPWSSRS